MRKSTGARNQARSLALAAAAFAACDAVVRPASADAATATGAAGFLEIPIGGGPAALGGAYTAQAHDAYAPVWNPGGLAFVGRSELATTHLQYLDSMAYEFASFVQPFPGGNGLGASVQYFRPGGISGTDAAGNPTADFDGHYAAYSLAYGRPVTAKLGVGAAARLLDANVGGVKGSGYAFDLGTMYRWDERLTVGAAVANAGSRIRFLEERERLQRSARAGATYWALPQRLSFSVEGVLSGQDAGARTGVELRLLRLLALRAGMDTLLAQARENALFGGVTMGLGFELMGQRFDYAWVPRGELGSTSYFSVLVRFGKAPPAASAAVSPASAAAPQPRPPEDPKKESGDAPDYDESQDKAQPPMLWLQ